MWRERELTPKRHKYREEDGGRVVEQVTGSGGSTGSAEFPVAAHPVAQRTHGDVVPGVADLHAAERGGEGGGYKL